MTLIMKNTQILSVAFLVLLSAICKARPANRTPNTISNSVYQVGAHTILDLVVDKLNRLQEEMDQLKQQQIMTLETREGTYSDSSVIQRIVGPPPLDCHEVRRREPRADSGVYMIKPRGQFDALPIYCEMDKEGFGWTVFQRRKDGSEDFNRNWRDYSRGFGNVSAEFWLGNEFLHHLTMQYQYILRVEVTDWFNRKYIADYAGFEVDSKRNDFRMTVEEFLGGNATDALTYHSGSKFTTTDKDNDDSDGVNCAIVHHGGWWFQACDRSNLNGLYYHDGTYGGEWDDGIEWKETDGPPFYSYKETKMMLRPWE
ncbi:ficolin-3-like [Lytechinus variegatus]|uniref:ficolin-3-like n=1 Tax=Lytechinus variegatus TaxID=7654 RepID=UPI001BB15C7E|nr:ficolin-3-like [Lytechinus variegatus]